MQPPSDPTIRKALAERALRSGRARLTRWVKANFADLQAARRDLGSTWEDLAAVARDAGQTNAFNQPPTSDAIRMAYLRVEKAMTAETKSRWQQPATEGRETAAPPPDTDPLADIRAGMAGSGRKPPQPI